MKERLTGAYETQKVKLILSVPASTKNRLYQLSRVYGTDMGFLLTIMTDELFYDPYSPTLPKRVEDMSGKVTRFFRKHHPEWQNTEKQI